MEAHVCNHPMVPHTVAFSVGSGTTNRPFDDLQSADAFAQKIIRQNASKRLSWLKIHRSDNESYVCFRWDNPKKELLMAKLSDDEMKVKLEVDMEPLKQAFDNVATGFKEQGKDIRKLQFGNLVLGSLLVVNFLADWVLR